MRILISLMSIFLSSQLSFAQEENPFTVAAKADLHALVENEELLTIVDLSDLDPEDEESLFDNFYRKYKINILNDIDDEVRRGYLTEVYERMIFLLSKEAKLAVAEFEEKIDRNPALGRQLRNLIFE
ncbi:hypothetical protein GCM10007415_35640 [Parapedobacter pyrenivorans]|uniref:DUF3347 domain-containing protein n=1 Tax=Parapedobacter pyrenivorans TaxID=1305674 RepID=A0A917HYV5_9SPHI|nr:hypothetical protein GCM10007415_35640 [Parapedobacter pyrenivorans]